MSLLKKPYEISIWEDVVVYVGKDSNGLDIESLNISDLTTVNYLYYTERLLAVIGSSTMTSPARTTNNIFKLNINGVETLTFDMYYLYEDIEEGLLVHNPLIDYVIDERKVKLHYENKWHDFIVKKDDEKGREYKYSYTCTGLAANELGKIGYNIELDTELENNMGTVLELGEEILRGSDWLLSLVDQERIDLINDEALYKAITNTALTATIRGTETTVEVPVNSIIYIYYTSFATQESNYFLFIYVAGNGAPDLLEDKITINCNNTRTFDLFLSNVTWEDDIPIFINNNYGVADYRGRRYVKKQLSTYDPVLERAVLKYTRDNVEYYGYTTTEYIDSTTVLNYIYNSTNFSGTSYWGIYDSNSSNTTKSIDDIVYPSVLTDNINLERAGYLVVNFGNSITARLVNEGIILNYSRIDKFDKSEKYRFRIYFGTVDSSGFNIANTLPFRFLVRKYTKIDEDSLNDIVYFDSNGITPTIENDYIIVDMECLQSATWRELKENVGIFFIPNAADSNEYYIKDVQFYKYVVGKNNVIIAPDDPVLNLPDVRVETKYHFYNPLNNRGKLSEEDYIFSEPDPTLYTPLYGSGENEFEKVRSITAKESNRFNLLQELSETFECWVRFEIEHEVNGRIKTENFDYYNLINLAEGASTSGYYIYDWISKSYIAPVEGTALKNLKYYELVSRKRQIKKVIFYKEILIDNYAGFKYGINLKDNNRTLDSELIVTKIIVKDNTCDLANNGFCSIARAKDNPIKENFIYNFDYYTSLGLINPSTMNNDLYLEINGSIGLYPRLSHLNKERNDLIDSAAPLANSINDLTSKYLVASLTYNEAEKELLRMKDPKSGTIAQYTHYIYEDFYNLIGRVEGDANVPSYANEIYYINSSNANLSISASSGNLLFAIPTEDIVPDYNTKTYYYISGSKFVRFQNTKFRDGAIYYEEVPAQYITGTYFLTPDGSDVTLTFSNVSSTDEVYIYGAARRRIENLGAEDYINDNFTISTLQKIVTQEANKEQAHQEMERYGADLEATLAQYDSILNLLKTIANATDEVEREFLVKYARYIQEGTWTDDNYMDDDLYYLDALSVLYLSAYPKVSYNFSVIDLSALEGYESYKFEIAHKTYVEDTEFFGYKIVNNLRTPVRELVVVTEASKFLDENDKNQLKIQNYKSHFEDLFLRITATTLSLEYHSGEYGRAANAITSTGEISGTVMQRSLANSAYVISNSRDLSVTWDDTGLLAINLKDPALITRLASAGLLVSADGGNTWGVAISGYGINTNYLTAGLIDADKINIMSGAYPTFKWDSLGLRAYGFSQDNNGNITSYDPSRYVAHDRFGVYGISGLTNANFLTVQDVKDNAIFGLTWDGLFIKSIHRDGYVSINSEDDITLKEYYTSNGTKLERTRGKFGLLSSGDTNALLKDIYGLALYDENLLATVETKSDGTLWLKSLMDIGDLSANSIYIGVGQEATLAEITKYGSGHGKKVFTVHGAAYSDETGVSGGSTQIDRFSVYEDGFIVSRGSYISGPINITEGGQIGNMTVTGLVDTVGIRLVPGNTEFKYNNSVSTPSSMTFTITHSFEGTPNFSWYKGQTPNSMSQISGANTSTYTYNFDINDFSNGIAYLKGVVTIGNKSYEDRITLNYVSDGAQGAPGKDATEMSQYTIHTNAQEVLKFIITLPTSGKYEFSVDDLRINAYNIKDQIVVSNTQIVNLVCKYADLDISIVNYKLKEIIKENAYSRYVEIKLNDDIFFYFKLGVLYQDSLGSTLLNNLDNSFTTIEKTEIVKNIQEFFNTDLASVDVLVYGQVIEQDFIKVDIDSTTFNEDKTLFYTKSILDNIPIYTQCTSLSIFDPGIDYYTLKIVEYNVEKYIPVKNGLSNEMLEFSVNAGSLNSAIQNTKLKFNENGLTITNGGIRIYTDNEAEGQEVFRIETGDGEKHLYLNGSGVFTGTIYAQSGEFTGTVHAQNGEFNGTINAGSGLIGGFTIDNDSIYAGNDKLNSPLLLQSSNGSLISVDNILIGTGAKIKDYLQLGNLKLLNPELYSNVMELKVANLNYFTLTNDGNVLGNNWSITKDENGFVTANFGNIIAQDGIFTGEVTASIINATTLNSVNFVTENIRAMGGAFIFKPTFKITTIIPQENNIVDFTLELNENDKNYFNLDLTNEYIISISGKDTHIGKINSINLSANKVSVYFKNADYNIFVVDGTTANYLTLTLFGLATVDALIGINSDDNWTGDIMPPRALIMEEFSALTETSNEFGDINYTPKLLLGNLVPLRQYNIPGLENISGYGLYADNVFLRGSLTTSGGNSYNYAGVNTLGPISFNYNSWNTSGATTTPSSQYSDDKIIFWGGAAGVQSNLILVSPFIVTDKGNIFARSGEFKGSVISDSLITNTIIKAPVIYGNNNQREGHEGEPSLKIYNTNTSTGGIGFYKLVGLIDEERIGADLDDILTLSISTNGFVHFNNEFISFNEDNGNIIFIGTKYVINNTELRDKELVNEASGIYFNLTGDSKLKLDYNNLRGIEVTKDLIINYGGYIVNEGIVEIKTIILNNSTKVLKYYVNNNNYYCLMVS